MPNEKQAQQSLPCLFGSIQLITRAAVRREAIAAVHGLITTRLEGNLSLLAAISTDRREHFALRASVAIGSAERSTALRAAARLILEALLRIERLLRSREDKFLTAIAANEGFILIHDCILLKFINLHRLALKARLPVGGAKAIQGGRVWDVNDGIGRGYYSTPRRKLLPFSYFSCSLSRL